MSVQAIRLHGVTTHRVCRRGGTTKEHASMMQFITRILSRAAAARADDRGASLVEYGLLLAFIAVAATVAVTALGGRIVDLFDGITF
jgi:pilus assembly protein Flp/PilA